MTILGSNVAAIKTELITRFTARAGLTGISVTYEMPKKAMEIDAIWFMDATAEDHAIAFKKAGGMLEIEEDVDLKLVVQALNADTQAAADTRAVAMLGEVFEEVMTNPRLGDLTGLLRIVPVSWTHSVGLLANSSKYASAFDVTLGASSLIKST